MTGSQGKTIILGITGGVAAYKAAELARLWVKAGYSVQVVMTEAATHFIGAATLQALTGKPVLVCYPFDRNRQRRKIARFLDGLESEGLIQVFSASALKQALESESQPNSRAIFEEDAALAQAVERVL